MRYFYCLKKIILKIFIIFFLFLFYLISIFVKVRIGMIYTSRIGHLSLNLDNFFSSEKYKRNKQSIKQLKEYSTMVFVNNRRNYYKEL